MPTSKSEPADSHAQALLRAADYLSRPQQFVPVAEARAAFLRTLEMVPQASVILTTDGEPAAAIVPFATLEAIRSALLRLLADEMDASFERLQTQMAGEPRGEETSEEELVALVDAAVRRARRPETPSSRTRR